MVGSEALVDVEKDPSVRYANALGVPKMVKLNPRVWLEQSPNP